LGIDVDIYFNNEERHLKNGFNCLQYIDRKEKV